MWETETHWQLKKAYQEKFDRHLTRQICLKGQMHIIDSMVIRTEHHFALYLEMSINLSYHIFLQRLQPVDYTTHI